MEVSRVAYLILLLISIQHFGYFTTSAEEPTVPAFEVGKLYVYETHGRLSTGIQDQPISQYSGIEAIGNIAVQNYKGNVQMRISNVKFKKFNQKFKNYFDDISTPFENPNQKMYQTVTYPFEVEFDRGIIKSIYFYSSVDTGFDQNVQRAIATAFQLNLHPQGNNNDHFYSVMEKGIGGECATLYQVSPLEDSNLPRLLVTKIPLYDKCTHKAQLFFSSIDGQPCDNCADHQILKRVARTDYVLKGTRDQYTIEKINVQGALVFNPFGPEGKTITVFANQTYTLVRNETAKQMHFHDKKFVARSPIYEFNMDRRNLNQINLEEAHYCNRFYDQIYPSAVTDTANLLSNMSTVSTHRKEQSKLLMRLIKLISRFNYRNFREFFGHVRNKFKTKEDENVARNWIGEIMTLVGTNPAIKFLLASIDVYSHTTEWNSALKNIPFYVKEPSEPLIKEFWNFLSRMKGRETTPTYETSILTFGSLLYKGCVPGPFNPHPQKAATYIKEKQCLNYLNKLYEAVESESAVELLYLAAIKNTRMEATFPFFAKIVANSHSSVKKRRVAIEAMANFLPKHDIQVTALVAPIFYNPKEDLILRKSAFDILLISLPTAETIASIIDAFRKEPYMKIQSYIYRSMVAFAESKYPCYTHMTALAKDFLKFVKAPRDDSIRHGFQLQVDRTYPDDNSHGERLLVSSFGSNDSVFPEELKFQFSRYAMGYNFDIEKLTISDLGQSIPLFLFHQQQAELKKATPSDIRNLPLNCPNMPSVDFYPSNTDDVETRKTTIGEKRFNQDVLYVHENYKSECRVKQRQPCVQTFFKKTLYHNMEYTIPTELGWPVTFSLTLASVFQHDGRFEQQSQSSSKINSFTGQDTTIEMMVEVNRHGYYHHGIKATSTFTYQFPLQGKISSSFQANDLMLNYTIPQTGVELYREETKVVTVGIDGKELQVKFREKPFQEVKNFGHRFLGAGLTSNYVYDDVKPWKDSPFLSQNLFMDQNIWKDFLKVIFSQNLDPSLLSSSYSLRLDPSKIYSTRQFNVIIKLDGKSPLATNFDSVRSLDIQIDSEGQASRQWVFHLEMKRSWPVGRNISNNFKFKRSAIPGIDKNPFEVCLHSTATKSNYVEIYEDIFLTEHQPGIHFETGLKYGSDCNNPSGEIIVKGHGERSEEQKSIDRKNRPVYIECKAQIEKKFPYHHSCWQVIRDQGRLDKFTFDVNFLKIPTSVMEKWSDMLIYSLKPTTLNYHTPSTSFQNALQISGNISYNYPLLDVHFQTPKYIGLMKDVYLPSIWSHFEPYTVVENYGANYLRKLFNYHSPMCVMSGNYIKTTDGVIYQMESMDKCFYSLFEQCEMGYSAIFVKTGTKGKVVIILLGKKMIAMDASDGSTIKVKFMDEQILKYSSNFYEKESLKFSRYGKGVLLTSPFSITSLYFDGQNIKIKLSDFLRGKSSGLCGNFNGEKVNEFALSNGTVVKNFKDLLKYNNLCGYCENEVFKTFKFCEWFRKL